MYPQIPHQSNRTLIVTLAGQRKRSWQADCGEMQRTRNVRGCPDKQTNSETRPTRLSVLRCRHISKAVMLTYRRTNKSGKRNKGLRETHMYTATRFSTKMPQGRNEACGVFSTNRTFPGGQNEPQPLLWHYTKKFILT